jgi:hypothetical protein
MVYTESKVAAVFFDGVQIYEAGLSPLIKDVDGKWMCEDTRLVSKVYSVLHLYGRSDLKKLGPAIYGYYITKDGNQIHMWTKRPTDEFREKYYQ